jgi:predicted aconitase with swiveling domain
VLSLISTGFRHFASVLFLALVASASFAGGVQSFADVLEKRGWHVDQDANGHLLLFPKTATHEAADSIPRSDGRDLDVLAGRLAATGWHVERSADGSIVFWSADKPGNTPQTIVESRRSDRLADLGNRLAATGWQVEGRADGSIVFWTARATGNTPEIAVGSRLNARLAALGARAAAAGWQVAHGSDGTVILWATETTNRSLADYSESTPDNWSHGTG